ncbi:UL20 protein [Gallid alphaherpesvirus 3]|uniref:UL20 protein n=3 Tax=Alphaherpesvirinae TaxID=10293 RepID=Q782S6_9ALPH|nr:envelope protein UL20 [Gallid alphaherpesvirus 3]YP_010795613.1 UL20-like protein [Gallid alphaherpesvirus 3]BAA33776.1 UL20 [Gallid alphaherpesvirus 1]BAA82914.1 UL20 product homolog [Marek's disease virus serotype 2 MDV2]AEI00222.1 UL20-like protein [Gallid alphaherpesvirus 3]QEY02274.1 UL20-like protein [Gallid alphaherpesvirus 3]BAB16528.1 UL20 protein [Gallid alphaherpesvirus 3]
MPWYRRGYHTTKPTDCDILLDYIGDEQLETNMQDTESIVTRVSDDIDCEDAAEYATMSSYLSGSIFTISKSCDMNPKFTRYVVLSWLSAFVLRPSCCIIFLVYAMDGHDNRFLILGATITAVFYGTLLLETYYMYRNIKNDVMPMDNCQQIFVGILSTLGAVIFGVFSYRMVFQDPRFMEKVLQLEENDKTDGAVVYLLMGATITYATVAVSDALGFLLPRLWTRALIKTCVPF